MTSLEALDILYPLKTNEPYYTRSERRNACRIIEKELKALKIIKKLGLVECEFIMCVDYETYKESRNNPISKQEYDLVKGVLLDG